jgi:hypothetical protein
MAQAVVSPSASALAANRQSSEHAINLSHSGQVAIETSAACNPSHLLHVVMTFPPSPLFAVLAAYRAVLLIGVGVSPARAAIAMYLPRPFRRRQAKHVCALTELAPSNRPLELTAHSAFIFSHDVFPPHYWTFPHIGLFGNTSR